MRRFVAWRGFTLQPNVRRFTLSFPTDRDRPDIENRAAVVLEALRSVSLPTGAHVGVIGVALPQSQPPPHHAVLVKLNFGDVTGATDADVLRWLGETVGTVRPYVRENSWHETAILQLS